MKTRRSRCFAPAAALLTVVAVFTTQNPAVADVPADRGPAALASAADAVERADIPGTAWGVDPVTKTLEVSADTTVGPAELATLRRVAARYGDAVTVERITGTLRPHVSGGSSVFTGSWRCTAGFNVRRGTESFFLTAGHCTTGHPDWYADPGLTTYIGSTVGSSFPGNDYGLVRYDNPSVTHPSEVRNATRVVTGINSAGYPQVGQQVCTTNDMISAINCGYVTAVNVTVNYGSDGVVSGLGRTNLCTQPGTSGAPIFSGTTAIGIVSGGSGCSSGGSTFFQPVIEALSAYRVDVG